VQTFSLKRIRPAHWREDVLQIGRELSGVDLHLERAPGGKPLFSGISSLHFNVTHTRNTGLAAFGNAEVGVDCEFLDRRVRARELAERFFSPMEAAIIRDAEEGKQTHRFLYHWTAKEAVLKLTGEGLRGGLDRCKVLPRSNSGFEGLVQHIDRVARVRWLLLSGGLLVAVAAWEEFRLAPPAFC